MGISGIISAIVVGLIVGALGRLAVPGRQSMGLLMTFLLGLVGAFIGLAIGAALHVGFLITLIIQIAVAALLVFLVAGGARRRTTI